MKLFLPVSFLSPCQDSEEGSEKIVSRKGRRE